MTNNVNTDSVMASEVSRRGMGKPAAAAPGVHELLRERWSPRAFAAAPVPVAELDVLLEAARWAPSSMNEQPWRFVVADRSRDAEGHARLVATLSPANVRWASQAPVLALVAAKTDFSQSGKPNPTALYDAGQAVAMLSVQATAMGLAVHQIGGFDHEAARAALGVPAGIEPIAVLAIGYLGDPDALDPQLRAREIAPRSRRPVSDWAYEGGWGGAMGPAMASYKN